MPQPFHVLEQSRKHGFMIVEADVCGDLHSTPNPLRLAQADHLERAIFLASFPKVASPALRVGNMAAAHLIKLLLEQKMLPVMPSSAYDERLVFELLSDGSYRKYLDRVRARRSHHHANAVRGLRDTGLGFVSEAEGDSGQVLRWAIACTRRGGTVSVPGVYARFIHAFLFGDAFGKGLTFKMGQTHMQRFMPGLLGSFWKADSIR